MQFLPYTEADSSELCSHTKIDPNSFIQISYFTFIILKVTEKNVYLLTGWLLI